MPHPTAESRTRPGEILYDLIVDRHWTIRETAFELEWWTSDVERMLKGNQIVTDETADDLARVFGPDAAFWLELQASYDEPLRGQVGPSGTDWSC